MHILIAVHGFPPLQTAGAEKAAERIAVWLVKQGHQVEVFTLNRLDQTATHVETQTQNGIRIHRLSLDLTTGEDPYVSTYDNARIGEAFGAILAQGHFDLVHLVSGYLLAGQVIHIAHRAGVPVVLTLTEYYHICSRLNLMHADSRLCIGPTSDAKCARCLLEEKRRYRFAARFAPLLTEGYWMLSKNSTVMQARQTAVALRQATLKQALEAADAVICPSRFIIAKHREYGFDTRDFVFIQHGLNRPARPAAESKHASAALRIGYMGQIKVHKGVDLLVDAVLDLLDNNRKVELQVWGRTSDQPEYSSQLIQSSHRYTHIQWKGGFHGEQVWNVLNGLDVLVVPSRWYENCPTVILEAFAAGIPVIATNLGGMAELVQPGVNGLLFELNQSADLREQLERLVREPGLLERLQAGIPSIKTGDDEVAEIFAQYQRVLAQGSSASGQ